MLKTKQGVLFGLGMIILLPLSLCELTDAQQKIGQFTIVDTGLDRCYGSKWEIRCPKRGRPFFGQDAQYEGNQAAYRDNGDGTITDLNTGLMWMKSDSGRTMNWEQALQYAEDLQFAGYYDWRLPNVKELQSIVNYRRAPDARADSARGAAIDPMFNLTDEESWFWTSTTHIEKGFGYYVCFGQALSALKRLGKPVNAHGAGAVRGDPKAGDPCLWPHGLGPQSDEIRVYNYVRCVRLGKARLRISLSGPNGSSRLLGATQFGSHKGFVLKSGLEIASSSGGRHVLEGDVLLVPIPELRNGEDGCASPGVLNGPRHYQSFSPIRKHRGPDDRLERHLAVLCPFLHYDVIDSEDEVTVCGADLDRIVLGGRRQHQTCETEDHRHCEYYLKPRLES